MLKTQSAKERDERYVKMNPREIRPFTRADAKGLDLGKTQVKMK